VNNERSIETTPGLSSILNDTPWSTRGKTRLFILRFPSMGFAPPLLTPPDRGYRRWTRDRRCYIFDLLWMAMDYIGRQYAAAILVGGEIALLL